MPNKRLKRISVIVSSLIITACYGEDPQVKTYTVYSTPSVCSFLIAGAAQFCTNFSNETKSIEFGGSFAFKNRNIPGFLPDWGTQYEVSVLEGFDDDRLFYQELLNYSVTSLDPIGTTYTFTEMDDSVVSIFRSPTAEYSFLGYDVVCEESICTRHTENVKSATFELILVDGIRKIEVVQLN